jgi:hypothetical protein
MMDQFRVEKNRHGNMHIYCLMIQYGHESWHQVGFRQLDRDTDTYK